MNSGSEPDSHPRSRRRRILVCAAFPPRLDARHGGKATAQLLLHLAERNDVAVLCLRGGGDDGVDPRIGAACDRVEEVALRPTGGARRRLGWTVGLVRGLPPWAADCWSAEFAARLDRLLAEWRPEVVELHLQAMAQYVEWVARSGVPSVLVDYDPASAWAEELLRASSGPRRVALVLEAHAWRRYERRTRPRFDAIVVFAERDLASVRAGAGRARIVRIPLAVDVPPRPLDHAGSEPPTVLFVGSFGHPPNVDAATWLARGIFPRVLEHVPDARLSIVGQEPGEEIRALAGGAVAVHGSVPSVEPYLDSAAVAVAPIRLGGSMRMKVLETIAAGKALVATPLAAEGVDAVPGEHYLLADDEDALVEALAQLLADRARRRVLGENARGWAERNLGWERGVEAFERLYEKLLVQR